MQLEIVAKEGQFPKEVSSPSREEAEVDLGRQQMRTSRDAIAARKGSRVDDHPLRSFYTW